MTQFLCDADKHLSVVSCTTQSFENENKATSLNFNIAKTCSGYDVSQCAVKLYILNPNNEADIVDLSLADEDEEYFSSSFVLAAKHTAIAGALKLWLAFYSPSNEGLFKTNIVVQKNREHPLVTDIIPDGSLTEFEQIEMRVAALLQEIEDVRNQIENHIGFAKETQTDVQDLIDTVGSGEHAYFMLVGEPINILGVRILKGDVVKITNASGTTTLTVLYNTQSGGGGGAIQHIKVNSEELPIEEETVDITVPTKVSELENDEDFAPRSELPTKVSELENDEGYLVVEEVEDLPTQDVQDNVIYAIKKTENSTIDVSEVAR